MNGTEAGANGTPSGDRPPPPDTDRRQTCTTCERYGNWPEMPAVLKGEGR
jgi:hypothetical protein